MVGAKAGLGYLINYAQYNFQVSNMYAGIITISALGLLFNWTLVKLEGHFYNLESYTRRIKYINRRDKDE
ncbi:hypothetical protein GCM10020331_059330 [Ectobacillus funiculus]